MSALTCVCVSVCCCMWCIFYRQCWRCELCGSLERAHLHLYITIWNFHFLSRSRLFLATWHLCSRLKSRHSFCLFNFMRDGRSSYRLFATSIQTNLCFHHNLSLINLVFRVHVIPLTMRERAHAQYTVRVRACKIGENVCIDCFILKIYVCWKWIETLTNVRQCEWKLMSEQNGKLS